MYVRTPRKATASPNQDCGTTKSLQRDGWQALAVQSARCGCAYDRYWPSRPRQPRTSPNNHTQKTGELYGPRKTCLPVNFGHGLAVSNCTRDPEGRTGPNEQASTVRVRFPCSRRREMHASRAPQRFFPRHVLFWPKGGMFRGANTGLEGHRKIHGISWDFLDTSTGLSSGLAPRVLLQGGVPVWYAARIQTKPPHPHHPFTFLYSLFFILYKLKRVDV